MVFGFVFTIEKKIAATLFRKTVAVSHRSHQFHNHHCNPLHYDHLETQETQSGPTLAIALIAPPLPPPLPHSHYQTSDMDTRKGDVMQI